MADSVCSACLEQDEIHRLGLLSGEHSLHCGGVNMYWHVQVFSVDSGYHSTIPFMSRKSLAIIEGSHADVDAISTIFKSAPMPASLQNVNQEMYSSPAVKKEPVPEQREASRGSDLQGLLSQEPPIQHRGERRDGVLWPIRFCPAGGQAHRQALIRAILGNRDGTLGVPSSPCRHGWRPRSRRPSCESIASD